MHPKFERANEWGRRVIGNAQLMSYMKLLDVPIGLLINFHEVKLVDGISRLILPGANREA